MAKPTQLEYSGIPASQGIAIGKVFLLDRDHVIPVSNPIKASEVGSEIGRFRNAVQNSIDEINGLRGNAFGVLGEKHLYLFDTHVLLLKDDLLVEETVKTIETEKVNAEWAFHLSVEKCIGIFNETDNEYLRERKNDIDQVKNRVLLNLTGHKLDSLANITEPAIIIARDLQPSDIVQMNKSKVLGVITEAGGRASHVGIIASALEIPAIVGLSLKNINLENGDAVILDGLIGKVYVNPGPETFKAFLQKQQSIKYYEKKLLENIDKPSETLDGVHVKLLANIEYSSGVEFIKNFGAEGVGLFRTEYLFMNRTDFPSEEEQLSEYKKVVETLIPGPVIFRTLDIGGDKQTGQNLTGEEKNPALGLRAIRFSFHKPDLFRLQVRAILRASAFGHAKIMFPMISGVEEVVHAKNIMEEIKEELREQGTPFNPEIPVGIMIETPSAVSIADLLAREVDFFSIGTNDLVQYALAVDRGNKNVAYLYKTLHPAILRMIGDTVRKANEAGIHVGICGEMGGNPFSMMALLGMGKIDEISMEPHSIPKIKKLIRSLSMEEARGLAREVMALRTTWEIENTIYRVVSEKFPDDFLEERFAGQAS